MQCVLARFPASDQAWVFGSVALGRATGISDLAIAAGLKVDPRRSEQKMALIEVFAQSTGRAIDWGDLNAVVEPQWGPILRHGQGLVGSDSANARLNSRHVFENTVFMSYRSPVVSQRCHAWIS